MAESNNITTAHDERPEPPPSNTFDSVIDEPVIDEPANRPPVILLNRETTPLHDFLQTQDPDNYNPDELFEFLNEEDIRTRSQSNWGKTPLHIAIGQNLTTAVEQLLESGAPVSAPKDNGAHPLHSACSTGNLEIVKLLLGRNPEINQALPSIDQSAINRRPIDSIIDHIDQASSGDR
ncbi:ankyrin repeat-containing domain protein, partial [Jackrogersella minutella]